MKISASKGPVNFTWPAAMPERSSPVQRRPYGRELGQAGFFQFFRLQGMSEAPKSTVLDWICLMPPPEPMDW
jgi:hypothetical protein